MRTHTIEYSPSIFTKSHNVLLVEKSDIGLVDVPDEIELLRLMMGMNRTFRYVRDEKDALGQTVAFVYLEKNSLQLPLTLHVLNCHASCVPL